VVVIAVILLVIVIGALISESASYYSPPPDPSPSDTSEAAFPSPEPTEPSPYPSEPSTTEPVQPTSEADLLRIHVPAPLSDSCTEREPPQNNPAIAALSCSASGESIGVDYYSYETAGDLSDTYQRDYSTDQQGDCRNGEEGSGSYSSSTGDRLGDFSCYATDDYYVLTWTHEPAGILTVAYSETVTYPSLITWTDANAGPTT
jgi:hypothetical protein